MKMGERGWRAEAVETRWGCGRAVECMREGSVAGGAKGGDGGVWGEGRTQ